MAPTGSTLNDQPQISEISDIIDSRSMSRFQIRTIILGGLVLFFDGFDAQTIGFLATSIAESRGIPVTAFGPIFSASLIGLMIAAMLAGPIADHWGRKWPIIFSTLALAVFSFFTAFSTSFNQLLIFRFLTGLGLGGALPNVVALSSEYVPKRIMAVLVAVLFGGLPLGGFVCGILSSALLPVWGWQSVFYIGGILPLLLSFLLILLLPESVRFLYQRGDDPRRVAKLMAAIAPEIDADRDQLSFAAPVAMSKGVSVKYLFAEGRAVGTFLLWIPNFMNLLLMYVIVNWLPALLRASGMSVSDGVTATSFFSLGGILGTLTEGFLIKFGGPYRILLVEFGLCGLFIASMAIVAHSWPLVIILAFLLGFLVIGAQAGLNVLAANFYPTFIRSTGVGWALGIGRIGSIVGPILAGMLLSMQWQPWQVLLSGAVPALFALSAILLVRWAPSGTSPYAAISDS
ncbi:MAG: MFS transporter [Deltaproteobacteria bacterium]|nr:MFS transporter [Deltaproteobacteria bacterium]